MNSARFSIVLLAITCRMTVHPILADDERTPNEKTPNRSKLIMQVCPHYLLERPGGWDKDPDGWKPKTEFVPDRVQHWMQLCEDLGTDTVFWSVGYVGKANYPSKVVKQIDTLQPDHYETANVSSRSQYFTNDRPLWEKQARPYFNGIAAALRRFNTLEAGIAAAKHRGMTFYAEVYLFDTYFPGLENDFLEEYPKYGLLSREQKPVLPIPCYAEPEFQTYRLRQIEELLDYGVDGIGLMLGSHIAGFGRRGADTLGYNPPVVQAYKERFGVDILAESFDPAKLHQLNGEFFTRFLSRVRQLLGPSRKLIVEIQLAGYDGYGGEGGEELNKRTVGLGNPSPLPTGPSYRYDQEWRKWIDEGIVDGLIVSDPKQGVLGRIQAKIKTDYPTLPIFLPRKAYSDLEYVRDVENELAAMRDGAVDGLWIRNMNMIYGDPQSPYPELLQRFFH